MALFLFCTAGVSYLISTVLHVCFLLSRRQLLFRLALWVLTLGFMFHVVSFIIKWAVFSDVIFSSFLETLFFSSIVLIAIYITISLKYSFSVLGIVIIPLAIICMYFSPVVYSGALIPSYLSSAWKLFHVSFSVAGQVFLAVASVLSFVHLYKEKLLKEKRLSLKLDIPALEVLDRYHMLTLVCGFAFLSLGILAGALWASQIWEGSWLFEPKQVWTFLGWVVYGALLHVRIKMGIRGRKAAWFSLVGIFLILFNVLGVTYLFPGRHGFGL